MSDVESTNLYHILNYHSATACKSGYSDKEIRRSENNVINFNYCYVFNIHRDKFAP